MEFITTKLKSVTWTNGKFCIFRTVDNFSVKGDIAGAEVDELLNVDIQLNGEWENHPRFGKSFNFSQYVIKEDEVFYFLTRVVKNIPEKTALMISKTYGESVFDILDKNPQELLNLKGVGEKRLEKIVASWKKNRDYRELSNLLTPHGVTNTQMMRIYEFFGSEAAKVIKEDPYRIIEIRGMGFKLADDIAIKIGVRPDSPSRLIACAEYTLAERMSSTGNSTMKASELVAAMQEVINSEALTISKESCEAGVIGFIESERGTFIENDTLSIEDRIKRGDYLTTDKLMFAESLIHRTALHAQAHAPRIKIVSDIEKWISDYELTHGVDFGDEQKDAIRLANDNYDIFSVSGYAGTGKTTTAKAILALIKEKYRADEIACCALAGIAANRIKAQTGANSSTIHGLLGFNGTGFGFGMNNKLPHKVVLLDESGMPDSELMYRLWSAIDFSRTKLIMLGDPAQLSPVSPGQPYSDLLKHKAVPNVTLTRIYRQSEDKVITSLAADVRVCKTPKVHGLYEDFKFHDHSIVDYHKMRGSKTKEEMAQVREGGNKSIRDKIVAIAQQKRAQVRSLMASANHWDYITNFQVVSPMRAGTVGVEALNASLQEVFNPHDPVNGQLQVGNKFFRPGDKVVHLRNKDMEAMPKSYYSTYLRDTENEVIEESRIFNGQLGIVVKVTDDRIDVLYPLENLIVIYGKSDVSSGLLDHSYALTVHKTQGSEFSHVLMPLTISHFNMLNPKLLYTGMTRAKDRLDLVGQKDALDIACKDRGSNDRVTCIGVWTKSQMERDSRASAELGADDEVKSTKAFRLIRP